ncbi:alpha/beta fold hydrolase [Acidobacteriota bacterium]
MTKLQLTALILLAIAVGCGGPVNDDVAVMSASDVVALPQPEPEYRLQYGEKPLQFGELRLPEGEGPFPVVIVIHGGCWLAAYDLGYMSAFADALTAAGVATWSIEYRRVGDEGGGWPGTFQDVADAADYLLEIALEYDLDLDRVAAVGHSAGGHLALWLAGRKWLDGEDPLRGEAPLALNGVVALAGIPDLEAYAAPEGCGSAVSGLLGGEPSEVPDRLLRASPIAMVPFGVAQTLVIGEFDSIVPESQARSFADAARQMGDSVAVTTVLGAGHFELVDPSHGGFKVIRETVLKAVKPAVE